MELKILDKKTKYLLAIFVIMSILDLVTTFVGLNNGFDEKNKISAYFFRFGLTGFFLVFIYESTFFYGTIKLFKWGKIFGQNGKYLKTNILILNLGLIACYLIKLSAPIHNALLIW